MTKSWEYSPQWFGNKKYIFKGNINSVLSNKNNWAKVFETLPVKSKDEKIKVWRNMGNSKMLVLNPNKLIFISLLNPLGVYNGNNKIIYSRTEN